MSMAISDELGQQNRILDDMDDDMEQATSNMEFVTRKTKDFIDQSGGTKTFMLILCLSVVVVVLVFLLLYT
jgi:t-SNARE complex subunit (syntaxin)